MEATLAKPRRTQSRPSIFFYCFAFRLLTPAHPVTTARCCGDATPYKSHRANYVANTNTVKAKSNPRPEPAGRREGRKELPKPRRPRELVTSRDAPRARVSGAEISPESNPVPPAADIAGFCRKRRRSAAALTGQCWWRLETLAVRRPPFVVARGWWEARNTVQLAGRLLLAESADLLLLFWVLILR